MRQALSNTAVCIVVSCDGTSQARGKPLRYLPTRRRRARPRKMCLVRGQGCCIAVTSRSSCLAPPLHVMPASPTAPLHLLVTPCRMCGHCSAVGPCQSDRPQRWRTEAGPFQPTHRVRGRELRVPLPAVCSSPEGAGGPRLARFAKCSVRRRVQSLFSAGGIFFLYIGLIP